MGLERILKGCFLGLSGLRGEPEGSGKNYSWRQILAGIGCFVLVAMICSSGHDGGMSCLGETVAPRSRMGVKRASGTT